MLLDNVNSLDNVTLLILLSYELISFLLQIVMLYDDVAALPLPLAVGVLLLVAIPSSAFALGHFFSSFRGICHRLKSTKQQPKGREL